MALVVYRTKIAERDYSLGGSCRIPSAFCGVFGIKPTPERVSYRDCANTVRHGLRCRPHSKSCADLLANFKEPGQTTYKSTVGFLSTSLEGIELILKSVLSTQPWLRDPTVVPIPWRQEICDEFLARGSPGSKALKIGIFWRNGVVEPHPPIRRGLMMIKDAIVKAGHQVCLYTACALIYGMASCPGEMLTCPQGHRLGASFSGDSEESPRMSSTSRSVVETQG